jgi:ribosomal protein L9
MESQVLEAYKDPESFLQARDPEYLLKRIKALEEKQAATDEQLRQQGDQQQQWQRARIALLAALSGSRATNIAAAAKLDELKSANPKLTKAEAAKALKAAGFSLTAAEIAAVFLVDFGE